MSLAVGIVGLPNVGKSTLFNALSNKQAEAANYAFCTIEPNVGVVPVPDRRFDALVELYQPEKVVPASVEFVDIAGLVKGASRGEGRGNAFLSNIRESDAIAHVVRCFEDDNVMHVDGRIDPGSDVETIETELLLKDLESVQRRLEKARRMSKGGDAYEKKAISVCERLEKLFDAGEPAAAFEPEGEDEARIVHDLFLLSRKPMFYVANVSEQQLAHAHDDPQVQRLRELGEKYGRPVVVISASIEAEIMQLPQEERGDFLDSVGLEEPGLNQMIQTGYRMLNLITYFTCGKPEVHARTIPRGTKAPQAAGKIHTDFERGFIRAEVIHWKDLLDYGSESAVRAAGKMRLEGKEYVIQDGDVVHYRFNV
jgi:hypothetical protein